MSISILIITPIRSFGQLIQQALQEVGDYTTALFASGADALEQAQKQKFTLSVLDAGISDINLADLVIELRTNTPDLRFVGISIDQEAQGRLIEKLGLDTCLPQPFYLPDLIAAVEEIAANVEVGPQKKKARPSLPSAAKPKKTVARHPAPDWLSDVNRAAQHLTRLSLESAAQAALITRADELWAYAGQLPQEAAEELAIFVGNFWEHDGVSDFVRFMRLDATGSEYMLYATGLGSEFVLALAFETEIPLSEMRSQAGKLAQKLAQPPRDVPQDTRVGTDHPEAPPPKTTSDEWLPEKDLLPKNDSWIPGADIVPSFPADWRPDQALASGRQQFFDELLSTMDIPDPDAPGMEPITDIRQELNQELEAALQPERAETPSGGSEKSEINLLIDTTPKRVEEPDDDLTQPLTLADSDLEPVTLALHNLSYASVLLPRLPRHHLVGDLASALSKWLPQLCLAFGWRLEHLSIRPDYVHWVASVPPATAPSKMIRLMRRHSSERIFKEFPRLAVENPSGDFWALGYLVMSGKQPTAASLIQEFVEKNRSLQGI